MLIAVHVFVGVGKSAEGIYELTKVAPLGTETAPTVRTDCLNAFLIILNGTFER